MLRVKQSVTVIPTCHSDKNSWDDSRRGAGRAPANDSTGPGQRVGANSREGWKEPFPSELSVSVWSVVHKS